MLIIGEKINGAIPAVKKAIEERDDEIIRSRVRTQTAAGADFIDCAASCDTAIEYDAMCWLIEIIQEETDVPICLDSPDAALLARLLQEGRVKRPGMINSVSLEGNKCKLIFPLIAGTQWNVIGLTCDDGGIPAEPEKRVEIAKGLIAKADEYGIDRRNLHIDPCVMSLAVAPTSQNDFIYCVKAIHQYAPEVKVTGAISNVSFGMPARKYVNMCFMTAAVQAGLDSGIMDPTSENMMGVMYAAAALCGDDKGGRKYNRAYRKGLFGAKK
ncbi:MAG: dihydropteroate synthase [Bacillota bacterium]|nr:dihydropteroate synthase [Bacillota bacterium]